MDEGKTKEWRALSVLRDDMLAKWFRALLRKPDRHHPIGLLNRDRVTFATAWAERDSRGDRIYVAFENRRAVGRKTFELVKAHVLARSDTAEVKRLNRRNAVVVHFTEDHLAAVRFLEDIGKAIPVVEPTMIGQHEGGKTSFYLQMKRPSIMFSTTIATMVLTFGYIGHYLFHIAEFRSPSLDHIGPVEAIWTGLIFLLLFFGFKIANRLSSYPEDREARQKSGLTLKKLVFRTVALVVVFLPPLLTPV